MLTRLSVARNAQVPWEELEVPDEHKYLYALARLVQHSRLFAVLESMDNGKLIRESRDIDIPSWPAILLLLGPRN